MKIKKGNKRLLFDIESDGLLDTVSKIWIMTIYDMDTKKLESYSDYDPELPDLDTGIERLRLAEVLVGHNIIGYDLVVLDRLKGFTTSFDTALNDTWLMSLLLRFKRKHKHSLEGWGEHLGIPKQEHEDWTQYSPEMRSRCETDVMLNVRVYEELVKEAEATTKINPMFETGLYVEMRFADIIARISERGWNFDAKTALKLADEMKAKLTAIEEELEPQIGLICMKQDSKDDYKVPAWTKKGYYYEATAKWFGVPTSSGQDEDRLIEGPYSRITYEPGKLSSDKVLKAWLYKLGWEPDEWNWERIKGNMVKKSPKLTDSSLELLGDTGKKVGEYNALKNKHGILRSWLEVAEKDGRLRGDVWTIGTPSFRCRHETIANLPTVETLYGKEMRGLLLADKGTVLVGADSAGNQMRGLCHYIGDDGFTHEVINGDVHMRNAVTLQEFTSGEPNRKRAKPFLYAFLFGGSAGKLAIILVGKRDAKLGQLALNKFQDSVPGFAELMKRLKGEYEYTINRFGRENGFIRGIDGRIIFIDSPHKILVYLLQTLEAITCKSAAVYLEDRLREEGIPFEWRIHYHDELAVQVAKRHVKRVSELAVEAFIEAPKWFGVTCMGGDAKVGVNYAEIH